MFLTNVSKMNFFPHVSHPAIVYTSRSMNFINQNNKQQRECAVVVQQAER